MIMNGQSPFALDTAVLGGMGFRNPKWDWRTFDFDKDVELVDAKLYGVLNAIDPDLRDFKSHGGKLVIYHGWSDPGVMPQRTVDFYHEMIDFATKAHGGDGRAYTSEYARLFMIPGIGHCRGGNGPDQADWMGVISGWVEKGKAPEIITARKVQDGKVTTTRPLCAYPQAARYKGKATRTTRRASSAPCRSDAPVKLRSRSPGALVAACALAVVAATALRAQESTGGAAGSGAVGRFLAPTSQIVAIRAGRLFDARSGRMLTGQTILVRGDKIAEVGANVNVPPEARVIDLGDATVMPGMIDVHVHVNVGGNEGARAPAERAYVALASAQTDSARGLHHGRRHGLARRLQHRRPARRDQRGPRARAADAGRRPVAEHPRGNAYPDSDAGRFYSEFTEGKNVNSPWLARAAVREAKLHGVDWVKIYTTQDFVGPITCSRRTARWSRRPSLTLEEVEAIVDEAHRLGLKVACHTYGGEGMRSCIDAGVDAPTHLLELDDAGVRMLLAEEAAVRVHARRSDLPGEGRPARQRRQDSRGSRSRKLRSSARSRPACRSCSAAARPRRSSRTACRRISSSTT